MSEEIKVGVDGEVRDDETVETLASMSVADLHRIKEQVGEALRMKGQKFIDGFRVGGLRCESVELINGKIKCRVRCGYGQTGWIQSGVLRSVLVGRGYDGGLPNTQPNGTVVITFFLPVDTLDEFEIEGIQGVVGGEVAAVTE